MVCNHGDDLAAAALDGQRLQDWIELFVDNAFYLVTSRENADQGFPVGLIYCEGRAMIRDRAVAPEKTAMHQVGSYRDVFCRIADRLRLRKRRCVYANLLVPNALCIPV
ncbi:MAG: hypothetical protein WA864_14735 [Acetobacteraceae bacterium]|jgi:anthranilate 1,2-dioxygenase small subunit